MINVNQITSKLAMMPDGALKQFAEMHKEDPYSFSLAIAESNRRKQIRTQAPPMQEQPKVADQELSAMTRPPEEVGIGALPVDMNMASGGIVAFGPGGQAKEAPVPSFDSALDAEGIDDPQQRAFLKAIYSQESTSGKNTKTSNRGAVGGMQILPSTFDSVADKGMDIKDPFDNMRAGIRYASQGYAKANGDPVLAGAYYYGGPGGMKKAAEGVAVSDPKNPKAPTTIDYGKSIADKMFAFLPMSSAQAETVQPPAATSDVDRSIPGQAKRIGQGLAGIYNRVTGSSEPAPQAAPQQAAPERVVDGYVVDERGIPLRKAGEASVAPVARDDRSIFERGADYAGIPQEFQRNFSNTLNAVGGGFGNAARVFKAAPSGAKALEEAVQATPEAVAAAAAAAQKVANVRLAKPAAQGIEALTPEAQALRTAAENAKMARNLKADKDAAALAQKSVDSANLASKSVGEAARLVDATKAAQVNKANKVVNAARINSGLNAAFGQDGGEEPAQPVTEDRRAQTAASMQSMQDALNKDTEAAKNIPKPEDLSKKEKKEVIDLAKENAPAKTKGFNNDDWLQFGLALMAGTSRYALQNVGTAGMSALAGKKEREKEERAIMSKMMDKTDMTKVIDRLMKDDPKLTYREAYEIFQQGKTNADLIARGLGAKELDANSRAVKVYQQAKEAIDSSIIGITGRSATATPAQKKAYADALAALGKNPAETVTAAPAAATMPLPGAKIVGSRPA
jgi:hypothetical protein